MKTEVLLINPKKAAEMLRGNHRNRNISHIHVSRLAKAMAADEWKLNGDAIRFNGTDLIDGQHRLNAIIKSGKSIKTLVITELECDVFDSIDVGKLRSAANTLQAQGEKNTKLLGAALRNVRNVLSNRVVNNDGITNVEIIRGLEQHPDLRRSVERIHSLKIVKSLIPGGWAAALHYLFNLKDEAMAELFFDALETGSISAASDPVHVLRQRLLLNNGSASKLLGNHIAALVVKSWNAVLKNEKIKILRWSNTEPFPQLAR